MLHALFLLLALAVGFVRSDKSSSVVAQFHNAAERILTTTADQSRQLIPMLTCVALELSFDGSFQCTCKRHILGRKRSKKLDGGDDDGLTDAQSLIGGSMTFDCKATNSMCHEVDCKKYCSTPTYKGTITISWIRRKVTFENVKICSGPLCVGIGGELVVRRPRNDMGGLSLNQCSVSLGRVSCNSCTPCDANGGIQIGCSGLNFCLKNYLPTFDGQFMPLPNSIEPFIPLIPENLVNNNTIQSLQSRFGSNGLLSHIITLKNGTSNLAMALNAPGGPHLRGAQNRTSIPDVVNASAAFIHGLVDKSVAAVPVVVNNTKAAVGIVKNKIGAGIPPLVNATKTAVGVVADKAAAALPVVINTTKAIVGTITEKVATAVPIVADKIENALESFKNRTIGSPVRPRNQNNGS